MKASPAVSFALLALTGSAIASKSHHTRSTPYKNNASSPSTSKNNGNSGGSCKVTSPFNPSDLVDLHNTARAACGAPEVVWDESLAAAAQCWANRCRFEHSKGDDVGENIAAGSGKSYSFAEGFADWFDEYKLWSPGMGYDEATGHFTQVAWKDTRRVGCGVASCSASRLGLGGDVATAKFLVCQYTKPGNVIGGFKGQVSLPKSNPIDKMVKGDQYQNKSDHQNQNNDSKREGGAKDPKKKHRKHKSKHRSHKKHHHRPSSLRRSEFAGLHKEVAA